MALKIAHPSPLGRPPAAPSNLDPAGAEPAVRHLSRLQTRTLRGAIRILAEPPVATIWIPRKAGCSNPAPQNGEEAGV